MYLDVGTNLGVQIRKLYEPQLYPNAKVLALFDKYFPIGIRNSVCTFGFEPNPLHRSKLAQLSKRYNAQGWNVRIF